jgi:hypothetical protein
MLKHLSIRRAAQYAPFAEDDESRCPGRGRSAKRGPTTDPFLVPQTCLTHGIGGAG